jgi:hypothetical protein
MGHREWGANLDKALNIDPLKKFARIFLIEIMDSIRGDVMLGLICFFHNLFPSFYLPS